MNVSAYASVPSWPHRSNIGDVAECSELRHRTCLHTSAAENNPMRARAANPTHTLLYLGGTVHAQHGQRVAMRQGNRQSVKQKKTCPIQTLQSCLVFPCQTKLLNVSLGRSDILSLFGFNDPSVQDRPPQMQGAYFSQVTNSDERPGDRTALTVT